MVRLSGERRFETTGSLGKSHEGCQTPSCACRPNRSARHTQRQFRPGPVPRIRNIARTPSGGSATRKRTRSPLADEVLRRLPFRVRVIQTDNAPSSNRTSTGISIAALGQSKPDLRVLNGTWKLYVEKSKYTPGPGPKSQTLTWKNESDWIRLHSRHRKRRGQTYSTTGERQR